ncbi:MAG: hypothetical protein LBB56_02005 [Chitinispirillales bacterium]|jgi:hypothetical protein|nr:hypothetical protein [Chitinispirillales bacterium]
MFWYRTAGRVLMAANKYGNRVFNTLFYMFHYNLAGAKVMPREAGALKWIFGRIFTVERV